MKVSSADFGMRLGEMLDAASKLGFSAVDLAAGALHRAVGGYPGPDHRMPSCCGVMRRAMRAGDEIVCEPEKGKGASLTVRYRLPRG